MNTNRLSILRQNALLRAFSRTRSLSLSLSSATVIILLASSAVSWGQLDVNDPWPKYMHDERNSGRTTTIRGPHSLPVLRWSAPLTEVVTGTPHHTGGAAIGYFNDERYIFVGAPRSVSANARLLAFRFHPDDPDYDPCADAALPVWEVELDNEEDARSTPLILPTRARGSFPSESYRLLVFNAINKVLAWDIVSFPNDDPVEDWNYVVEDATGGKSSPNFGRVQTTANSNERIYVVGAARLHCLQPSSGAGWWIQQLVVQPFTDASEENNSCSPALGPVTDSAPRKFVYAATYIPQPCEPTENAPPCDEDNRDRPDFHALYADAGQNQPTIAWRARIADAYWNNHCDTECDPPCSENPDCYRRIRNGSQGSPSVHDNGDVVVGSDAGTLYGFWPTSQPQGDNNERWNVDFGEYISMTPGIAPPLENESDANLVVWVESGIISRVRDEGTDRTRFDTDIFDDIPTSQFDSAPAIDAARRIFVCYDGNAIVALTLTTDGIRREWTFTDFIPFLDCNEATTSLAPIAIDADGTLIAVIAGHILALRPLPGDFNGDGVTNNYDIDPFVLALMDDYWWEHTNPEEPNEPENPEDTGWGERFQINLLGVGDCNNDGLFNNFDIDCFSDLLSNPPGCEPCQSGASSFSAGGSSWDPEGPSWEYVQAQLAALREHFGME